MDRSFLVLSSCVCSTKHNLETSQTPQSGIPPAERSCNVLPVVEGQTLYHRTTALLIAFDYISSQFVDHSQVRGRVCATGMIVSG